VSIKNILRKIVLYLGFGVASLLGGPMKVEEIAELLVLMNQSRIEVVVKEDEP
jgi:hypothetical protein